jgi:glycosyltransferase involved in cell wall biosynthesis
MRSADYIISVSEVEKELIEEKLARKSKVILLGHSHSLCPTRTPFEERRDLVFLGGFKSSPGPNDDAVVYFVKTIFPRIQEKIPGIRFIIAGSNAPDSVSRLASDTVSVIGYVEDLCKLYERCRIFVAPIRFGAGAMWKVTEAMSYGIPSVLSRVAAEGMRNTNGKEALVAQDEEDFVDKTVLLYQDRELWNQTRKFGLEYVAKNCDPIAMEKNMGEFLNEVSQSLKRRQ